MEVVMLVRMRVVLLVVLLSTSLAIAGGKKKILLPDFVLKAHTVRVIVDPDAGTSMTAPQANKTAQDEVEKALMKWGRLRPVMEGMPADLVITVRKGSGKIVQPTISGEPTNDRPVVVQPTDNGIRIGGQQGRSPNATQSPAEDPKPRPQMEAGPPDDMFVVYEGGEGAGLEGAVAWHYSSKDALRSPDVPAVAEFRKIIEAAEKQKQSKP
jgi:hypothetical protein